MSYLTSISATEISASQGFSWLWGTFDLESGITDSLDEVSDLRCIWLGISAEYQDTAVMTPIQDPGLVKLSRLTSGEASFALEPNGNLAGRK